MTTAICTGSFDPITLGHTDVIRRAAACFDRVVICVAANTEKRNQLFTGEEKLALVQAAVADLPNVEAELWPGLVVDFARRHGATVIVRGARSASDFDAEYAMGIINGKLLPGLDTVILPAHQLHHGPGHDPLRPAAGGLPACGDPAAAAGNEKGWKVTWQTNRM